MNTTSGPESVSGRAGALDHSRLKMNVLLKSNNINVIFFINGMQMPNVSSIVLASGISPTSFIEFDLCLMWKYCGFSVYIVSLCFRM